MHEVAFRFILHGIIDGALIAGDDLDERSLAERISVPESTVRDAIAHIAILNIADADDFGPATLVEFTSQEAIDEARNWAALHEQTLTEVWGSAAAQLPYLRVIHDQYLDSTSTPEALAANFEFFAQLRALIDSPSVSAGADTTAYRFFLAQPLLPQLVSFDALRSLQASLIRCIDAGDLEAGCLAIATWLSASTR